MPPHPSTETIEIKIDNRRGVEREKLRQQQAPTMV
jgi:hypothetical protein